jgi:hypothetical protein
VRDEDAVLQLIVTNPKISKANVATTLGWTLHSGEPHKTKAVRCLKDLERQKLIKPMRGGGYKLTPEGKKAIGKKDSGNDDDDDSKGDE